MRVAGFQNHIPQTATRNEKLEYLEDLSQKIEREYVKHNGFDILLLPELSVIEYSNHSFNNLKELAEPLQGDSFDVFSKLSRKLNCFIVYGFPLVSENKYYISQSVISNEGEIITNYNKIHIAQFGASSEKNYFERGDKLAVFEVNGWKFGIIICYDIRFPELSRELCIKNDVDFILHPVAFYKDNSFPSWHHFLIARALENQSYYLSLNRSGKDYGNSIFCPPWIDNNLQQINYGEKEQLIVFEPKKEAIEDARRQYNFRGDKLNNYHRLSTY